LRGSAKSTSTARFVSQQIHYTLEAREAEYELAPIALDQGLGILVWSPLAWTPGRPAVVSVIIGGRTEAQLRDNLGAADITLSAAQRERLDKVSAPPLLYPYWHQANTASDRLSAADLSLLGPHLKKA
jgi:aryl-alcohol dehydrogenase-like predicted oxidoreductase